MHNKTSIHFTFVVALTFLLVPQPARPAELIFNTQDFPPFNYAIDGVVSGPAAAIIQRACKEIDASCTMNLLPWKRAQEEVRSGKANGVFVIGWNEKRANRVHFAPPIMTTEYGFVVKADNPLSCKQFTDVQGYKVGVFGPSNTANSLEKVREQMQAENLDAIKIDIWPDDESGFKKLLDRFDAAYLALYEKGVIKEILDRHQIKIASLE